MCVFSLFAFSYFFLSLGKTSHTFLRNKNRFKNHYFKSMQDCIIEILLLKAGKHIILLWIKPTKLHTTMLGTCNLGKAMSNFHKSLLLLFSFILHNMEGCSQQKMLATGIVLQKHSQIRYSYKKYIKSHRIFNVTCRTEQGDALQLFANVTSFLMFLILPFH